MSPGTVKISSTQHVAREPKELSHGGLSPRSKARTLLRIYAAFSKIFSQWVVKKVRQKASEHSSYSGQVGNHMRLSNTPQY